MLRTELLYNRLKLAGFVLGLHAEDFTVCTCVLDSNFCTQIYMLKNLRRSHRVAGVQCMWAAWLGISYGMCMTLHGNELYLWSSSFLCCCHSLSKVCPENWQYLLAMHLYRSTMSALGSNLTSAAAPALLAFTILPSASCAHPSASHS